MRDKLEIMKETKKHKTATWELAPALESSSHIQLKESYDLFIDGTWVKPESGVYFDSINPANEEKLAKIAHANEAELEKHTPKYGPNYREKNVENTFSELHA